MIWVSGERENFCKQDWPASISLILFNKFTQARRAGWPGGSTQRLTPMTSCGVTRFVGESGLGCANRPDRLEAQANRHLRNYPLTGHATEMAKSTQMTDPVRTYARKRRALVSTGRTVLAAVRPFWELIKSLR